MRVLIVGAGIMGLSTARALRSAGHEPIVFERGSVPNPDGSSVDHHRAIRLCYGAMHGYARMVLDAYAAWERLWADLGVVHYAETGQLMLGEPGDPWITASLASLERLGEPFERLSEVELAGRFPMIRAGARGLAVAAPKAGALFAEPIVRDLAAWLGRSGVTIRARTEVETIDPARARVRLADGTAEEGDALLVTAGAWLGRLRPEALQRSAPSRQVVLYCRAPTHLRDSWARGPVIIDSVRYPANGFYALPAVSGTHLKWGDHRFSLDGDLDADRTASAAEIDRVRTAAASALADIEGYEILQARSCFYNVTPDERFMVERQGRTTIVSACSGHGFKFGALIGERLATSLLDDHDFPAFRRWLAGEDENGGQLA